MNCLPPAGPKPSSRGIAAGRWLALLTALAVTFAGEACETRPDETLAGLVIASNGTVRVTDAAGQEQPIEAAPDEVRSVTASTGRIAVETADHEFLVSDAADAGGGRAWRPLTVEGPSSGRTPAGMDLSLDGRTLAVVFGDPEAADLELVVADVAAGTTERRSVDLMANGPPSWLGSELLALEVIRPDQHSGIATVDPTTGDVIVTDVQGFAPSVTRDGAQIAVVNEASGLVAITNPTEWLSGVPSAGPGITPPTESSIQDVAIDADGTRLALVYASSSGVAWTVVILRRDGTVWESELSIPIPGNARVSVDWLD